MAIYTYEDGRTYKVGDDGERSLLANFTAQITQETRYLDGQTTETQLTIVGQQINHEEGKDPEILKLAPVTIRAEDFAGMAWAMPAWGVRTIICPGQGIKDDLRTAIQLNSRPTLKTIYRHVGWTEIDGKPAYLHSGGAIKPDGNDPSVSVQLPTELSRYNLTGPATPLPAAIKATLALTDVAPPAVSWPLLAATVAPLLGPVDFAIHVTGKTGTYKSELLSLYQSHYGHEMDARHLPGSWSSTPNAIEAQAYLAANAPYVLDDFVPNGTSSQVRAYQTTADKIIRSQGNQAGRARLTDTSSLQTAMYPRGIILSTGEDTPEGHSVRARMLIIELAPGDIDPKNLTTAQRKRGAYPSTIAAYAQDIAKNPRDLTPTVNKLRDSYVGIGHTRTPSMIARLSASLTDFLDWCDKNGGKTANLRKTATSSLKEIATRQNEYLEAADPCDIFCQAIRQLLASLAAHVRTTQGGIPKGCETLGWTQVAGDGELPSYKSHGPCIGWITWKSNELFLEINNGLAAVKKIAGQDLPMSRQTMLKRLKDSGHLTRTDSQRQRNTVRITAENHPRQVLALNLAKTLDTQEQPSD
jgi:hypothetical protein